MNCWYDLRIENHNALRSDYVFPNTDKPATTLSINPTVLFTQEWLDYMRSFDLEISNPVLVFCKRPYFRNLNGHIDISKDTDSNINEMLFAFNWLISGKNSTMAWYERNFDLPINVEYNPQVNLPHVLWPLEDLKDPIDTKELGSNVTIVRTNLPHAIFVADEIRWSISARTVKRFKTWNDIIEHLDKKNLLIPR